MLFCSVQLAANADIFVNDAFGTAHRAHASTEGVTKFLSPSVAGLLLQKELDYLDGAVKEPKRPFVAIVGGSKVSSKIGVIESLLEKTDKIILGCVQLLLYNHTFLHCHSTASSSHPSLKTRRSLCKVVSPRLPNLAAAKHTQISAAMDSNAALVVL